MAHLLTDIDPYCCAVLRERVARGDLAPSSVLEADIAGLGVDDLRPYRQIHLFGGIGGSPLGLMWAGWPDELSIVTGGFPCQDISAAGRGEGLDGKRSGLFWEMHRVVDFKRPLFFLAENVGALSARGLDRVARAMESLGYAVQAFRLGAWALGSPQGRERWWIVGRRADSLPQTESLAGEQCERRGAGQRHAAHEHQGAAAEGESAGRGQAGRLADRPHPGARGLPEGQRGSGEAAGDPGRGGQAGGGHAGERELADAVRDARERTPGHPVQRGRAREAVHAGLGGGTGGAVAVQRGHGRQEHHQAAEGEDRAGAPAGGSGAAGTLADAHGGGGAGPQPGGREDRGAPARGTGEGGSVADIGARGCGAVGIGGPRAIADLTGSGIFMGHASRSRHQDRRDRQAQQPAALGAGPPGRWVHPLWVDAKTGQIVPTPQYDWEPPRIYPGTNSLNARWRLGLMGFPLHWLDIPDELIMQLSRKKTLEKARRWENKEGIKVTGNTQVPQCVAAIARGILEALMAEATFP